MNEIILKGTVVTEPKFSHDSYGEKFNIFTLSVPRLSGSSDFLPVVMSDRIMPKDLQVNDMICIKGDLRTYNRFIEGKSKLIMQVFAKSLHDTDKPNIVKLEGYICKQPTYRKTPFDREITDLLIAVNSLSGKTAYIPCIAWGRNASFASTLEVGSKIIIDGRLQSREYQKKISDTEIKTMTTYEVSVSMLQIVEETKENEDGQKETD